MGEVGTLNKPVIENGWCRNQRSFPFLVTMFFFFFKDGPSVGPDEINL